MQTRVYYGLSLADILGASVDKGDGNTQSAK
jgi:hypothetical protein